MNPVVATVALGGILLFNFGSLLTSKYVLKIMTTQTDTQVIQGDTICKLVSTLESQQRSINLMADRIKVLEDRN